MQPDDVEFKSEKVGGQDDVMLVSRSPESGRQISTMGRNDEHWKVDRMMTDERPPNPQKRRNGNMSKEASPVKNGFAQQKRGNFPTSGAGSSYAGTIRRRPQTNHGGGLPGSQLTLKYFDQAVLPTKTTDGVTALKSADQTNLDSPKSLRALFKNTDGYNRGSFQSPEHDDGSSDELAGPSTVGVHADVMSVSPPKLQGASKQRRPLSPKRRPSPSPSLVEPSQIRPSTFQKNSVSIKRRTKEDSDFEDELMEETSWSIPVAAINIPGELETRKVPGVGLVFDPVSEEYYFKREGKPYTFFPYLDRIRPKKLIRCWWEESGRMIRLMNSQDGGQDHYLDFISESESDLHKLLGRFSHTSVKVKAASREQMEKLFANRRTSGAIPEDIELAMRKRKRNAFAEEQASIVEHTKRTSRDPNLKVTSNMRAQINRPPRDIHVTTNAPHGLPDDRGFGTTDKKASDVSLFGQPAHNSHLRRSARNSGISPLRSLAGAQDEEEVEKYSKIYGLGSVWSKPLVFPKEGKKRVTVEWGDLERLDDGEFLNDNLTSFYLRYLEHKLEKERPDVAQKIYLFNSFFYERLMALQKGQKDINYEAVNSWTRRVDLFTYDFIIIPINENYHWYVAIICNLPALDRQIDLSDGLGSQSSISDGTAGDPSEITKVEEPAPALHSLQNSPERETAHSFAELSLDGQQDKREGSSDSLLGMVVSSLSNKLTAMAPKDDEEMLDMPIVTENPDPEVSLLKVYSPPKNVVVNEASEDLEDSKTTKTLKRKQKRKSAPPIASRDPELPTIITFDSFDNPHPSVNRALRLYLVEEAKSKRGGMKLDETQIKGMTAKNIPHQSNFSDCGLFMLGYVEKMLLADPREFIAKIIKREYDVKTDWPLMNPKKMRSRMREQLLELHRIQQNERRETAKKAGKYSPGSRLTDLKDGIEGANAARMTDVDIVGGEDVGSNERLISGKEQAENQSTNENSNVVFKEPSNLLDLAKIPPAGSEMTSKEPAEASLILIESHSPSQSQPDYLPSSQPPLSMSSPGPPMTRTIHNRSTTPPAEIADSQTQPATEIKVTAVVPPALPKRNQQQQGQETHEVSLPTSKSSSQQDGDELETKTKMKSEAAVTPTKSKEKASRKSERLFSSAGKDKNKERTVISID